MKVTLVGALVTVPQRLGKGDGRHGNQRPSGDLPDYRILKIGQNTEKSPGDLNKFAVTQTPAKDHQLLF